MDKKSFKQGIYEMPKEKDYPEGLKWTKQRKAVYDVLRDAKEPLNAVKIYNQTVTRTGGEEFALSTIYRILTAFEENDLIEKEAGLEDGVILYTLNTGAHMHYAVCLECHKRIPLQNCPFMHIHIDKETEEFSVVSHKLEVYGYCKECKKN